jgi:two-component system, NarL family, sensor histidine kinase UhpB
MHPLRLGNGGSGDLARSRKRLEARKIIEIAQREQQRIGSDLHDGLGQDLTGIALLLRAIEAQLRKEGSAARSEIEHVIGLVNAAIENTRALARGLSPVGSEPHGLSSALRALAAGATERYGIPVTFQERIRRSPPLDPKSATHLYRIAQEALTNAMRHGGATRVKIVLTSVGSELQLRVCDNGRGLPGAAGNGSAGLGLKIMRRRAQMCGGNLSLDGGVSGGTVVRCSCPLESAGSANGTIVHAAKGKAPRRRRRKA